MSGRIEDVVVVVVVNGKREQRYDFDAFNSIHNTRKRAICCPPGVDTL